MSSELLLLDTHELIYWQQKQLPEESLTFLNSAAQSGRVCVSTISFWEIALLVQKRRLRIEDINHWISEVLLQSGVRVLEPTWHEMVFSVKLPRHHNDPFDRLLIAQALSHNCLLVTRDRVIRMYDNVSQRWL